MHVKSEILLKLNYNDIWSLVMKHNCEVFEKVATSILDARNEVEDSSENVASHNVKKDNVKCQWIKTEKDTRNVVK